MFKQNDLQGVKVLLFPPFFLLFQDFLLFSSFLGKMSSLSSFFLFISALPIKFYFLGNFKALVIYFFKKFSSLASLGMNIISFALFQSHFADHFASSSYVHTSTLLIISFHHLMCILLHFMHSSHNLFYL